jgi:hypothetical protein
VNRTLLTSVLWLSAVSLCAAVFVSEHVWLAIRVGAGKEKIARLKSVIALFVPGAAPVLAWRAGVRVRLLVYVTTLIAYCVLRWIG